MAFDTQIQALTGTATDSEMDQWLTDGAKEIINILPSELKEKCMTETTLNNSSPTMDLDGVGNILYVSRLSADSGGYRVSCRKVPSMHAGLTSDSSSLFYYGTVTCPVYWIQSTSDAATLNVYPSPEATQTARVYHVTYPSVNADTDSSIANFPDEAEYLVVLYAACKVLQNKMNEKNGDLPSDITLPSTPVAPPMNEKSVSITGTAPTYTKPALVLDTLSITDLSISASSPSSIPGPVISSPGITAVTEAAMTSNVPTYTKPVFALESKPSISNLSITAVAPVAPTVDLNTISFSATAPTYTPPVTSPDFSDASSNWLTAEEDSELVASRMQIISGQLQEYQSNIQSAVNTFNKENAVYQASLQTAIQDGQLAESEEGRKLQKYSNDLQTYQADVNKEVQEYRQNFEKELQLWQANNASGLQQYSNDIQNELNEFNKENIRYQAEIQAKISKFNADVQDAQKEGDMTFQASIQDYQLELQKFTQDISKYQADVNKEVQEWTNNFQKDLQIWQSKRQTDLSKYSADIQNELNEFNKENIEYQSKLKKDLQDAAFSESKEGRDLQKYSNELSSYQAEVGAKVQEFQTKLQKHDTAYKWYQGQYAMLKQDYNKGIQLLVSGGLPQQQKGEG